MGDGILLFLHMPIKMKQPFLLLEIFGPILVIIIVDKIIFLIKLILYLSALVFEKVHGVDLRNVFNIG